MYNSRLWVISPRTLKILFHCLLTFTADILVVYALWIFCFVLLTVLFLRKLSFRIQSFVENWREGCGRKMRMGLSLLRFLLWLGTMFCFVLFFSSPNYVSVPSTVQDLVALKESTISRVCLPLLLHLLTFFPPPILKISFAFLSVKHSFWREVNTK